MKKKPNIILMMVDQMRWDFLGINGNELIDTPNLDMMANFGYNFKSTYTAVASCIASRAAVMTGMKQTNHGRVGYKDNVEWNYENMLADEFSKNGYHTQCVGKMHVYPERKLCGFHNVLLHDGYLNASRKKNEASTGQFEGADDYLKWFREKMGSDVDLIDSGLSCNSWIARPYMHPEWTHPSNWLVTESIDFLRRKDPTKPFFLKMSFVRPHSPLDPPEFYYNHYKDSEVRKPVIGKWNSEEDSHRDDYDIDAKRGIIKEKSVIDARRAYSGSITHIDDQIRRFLIALEEYDELENTIILFTSDHGDMLGDHHFFRKAVGYEGSVHVPLIVYDPGNNLNSENGKDFDEVLELRDIMPSLLDFAGLDIPESVDGRSVKNLITGDDKEWRDYIHGEHSFDEYSNHYITDGKKKFIWYSQSGIEQFFDLEKDPYEMDNLMDKEEYKEDIEKFKAYLIDELKGREEGYTDGKELIVGRAPIDVLRDETL